MQSQREFLQRNFSLQLPFFGVLNEQATVPEKVKSMSIENRVDDFIAFISERESVRHRREEGRPWPWTTNPILRDYRFCNVQREHDRVTKSVSSLYREPHNDEPELWFALLVARRAVNWPETLSELGFPVPWQPEHFKRIINRRRSAGQKAFEASAYKLIVTGKTGDQADLLVRYVLDPIWSRREELRPRRGESLASFGSRLAGVKYMGGFYAGQVVADLKYVQLCDAKDWWTYAVSGPGSRRGLDRLHGRTPRKYGSESEWLREFNDLYAATTDSIFQTIGVRLHAQDLQNCLCEYDKYRRLLNREGVKGLRRFSIPESADSQMSNFGLDQS
jgi:5-hmdU DNA kinase-like protein